jgi:uncharacterized protein (DUF934 family)
MSVIVTDNGFSQDSLQPDFLPIAALETVGPAGGDLAVDLPSDTDPEALSPVLERAALVRVDFPSSADGRGFTIARRLRLMGYKGRLRAKGHVIADQYALARRSGFDEVEIDEDLARRQPEPLWTADTSRRPYDYQSRLRG